MPGRHEEGINVSSDTIILYLYRKIDEDPLENRTWLKFPPQEKPYQIEDLSIAAAQHLEIGSAFFLLFGICDPDVKLWYRPNHIIELNQAEQSKPLSFVFRMRYYPPIGHLSNFLNSEKSLSLVAPFLRYYFQQMFSDFVSGHLDDQLASIELSKQWGLGALGMYCFCKQREMTQDYFTNSDYGKRIKMFLPINSVEKIHGPFPQKRLSKGLFKVLKQLFDENQPKGELDNLLQYIHVMWQLIPNYSSEEFVCSSREQNELDPESIVVDSQHENMPGIRFVFSRKPSEHFCSIADLKTLSYIPTGTNDSHIVILNRKSGPSRPVEFSSELTVYSFISMLDGAYRLTSDWIYHLASEVESPLLTRLRKLNCFGPVRQSWALKTLQNHCRDQERHGDSYMLCQERANLTEYRLFVEGKEAFYRIVLVDNKYQVARHNEPLFPSMEQLIQYYSRPNDSGISTVNKVILRGPFDPMIYLLQDEKAADESHVNKPDSERIKVIQKIDNLVFELGEGQMTKVFQGMVVFHGDTSGLTTVAVKRLKKDDALNTICAENFLDGIHAASSWNHSAIVGIRSICLSPLSLVLDRSEIGNLEQYLRNPRLSIQLQDLLLAAEQLAEALRYLQEECLGYDVHGNIRCRNLLVFSHQRDHAFEVKLSDPGMVYAYCKLPLDHPLNLERLPWIAPECYSNLGRMTCYSDCFAFGMTLWEMFSKGDIPYAGVESKKIIDCASRDIPLLQPENCPDKMYSIMRKCWNVIPDERTPPKEMLRVICDMKSQGEVDQLMIKRKLDPNGRVNIPNGKVVTMPGTPPGALGGMTMPPPMLERLQPTHPQQQPQAISTSSISQSMLQVLPQGSAANATLSGPGTNALTPGLVGMGLRRLPRTPLLEDIGSFIPPEELKKDNKRLGEGHYARVHSGTYKGMKVAIKTLKKEKYEKFREDFDKELAIMVKLEHPNILNVLGYSRSKSDPMSLVLEYLEHGSLQMYLKKNKKKILEEQNSTCMKFALEICEGMLYLAERDVPLVHCDLAARNVLVSKDLHCKISDFGMSRMLEEKDYYRAQPSREMPLRWCAPEVLEQKKYTEKSDVWSYGVTLWEVFTAGDTPNLLKPEEEKDLANQVHTILHCLKKEERRLPAPAACPDAVYLIMLNCWVIDTNQRSRFADIKRALKRCPNHFST